VYLSDPPLDENDAQGEDEPSEPMKPDEESKNRIVILGERDIPFQEERPPNQSPNYEVKVHRARRKKEEFKE
jgi:hypothetical protein